MPAVAERPFKPSSNFMVGTQRPKSRPAIVEAWKPPKVPVTGSETFPAPTAGEEQTRVCPEPVHVPAAAPLAAPVATGAALADATLDAGADGAAD